MVHFVTPNARMDFMVLAPYVGRVVPAVSRWVEIIKDNGILRNYLEISTGYYFQDLGSKIESVEGSQTMCSRVSTRN